MTTAGLVVIGNEILSGKVVDTNSPYLAGQLRELGVFSERSMERIQNSAIQRSPTGCRARLFDARPIHHCLG